MERKHCETCECDKKSAIGIHGIIDAEDSRRSSRVRLHYDFEKMEKDIEKIIKKETKFKNDLILDRNMLQMWRQRFAYLNGELHDLEESRMALLTRAENRQRDLIKFRNVVRRGNEQTTLRTRESDVTAEIEKNLQGFRDLSIEYDELNDPVFAYSPEQEHCPVPGTSYKEKRPMSLPPTKKKGKKDYSWTPASTTCYTIPTTTIASSTNEEANQWTKDAM